MTVTDGQVRSNFTDGRAPVLGHFSSLLTGTVSNPAPDELPRDAAFNIFAYSVNSRAYSGEVTTESPGLAGTNQLSPLIICSLFSSYVENYDPFTPAPPLMLFDPVTGLYSPRLYFVLDGGLLSQFGSEGQPGSGQYLRTTAFLNSAAYPNASAFGDFSPGLTPLPFTGRGTIDGYDFAIPCACVYAGFTGGGTASIEVLPTVQVTITPAVYWQFATEAGNGPIYASSGASAINPASRSPWTSAEIAAAPLP